MVPVTAIGDNILEAIPALIRAAQKAVLDRLEKKKSLGLGDGRLKNARKGGR